MLSLPAAVSLYLYTVAFDIRWSFDGQSSMTEQIIRSNPLSLQLFVFCDRRGDLLNNSNLNWDRDVWEIQSNMLEAGIFQSHLGVGGQIDISHSQSSQAKPEE